jgi:RNA polymerase subunit RPABC4/transcription elongation factor Spt4
MSWADDDDTTVPCRHCGRPVFEDAEQCPACGHYLTDEELDGNRSWWFNFLAVVCLIVAVGWALLAW